MPLQLGDKIVTFLSHGLYQNKNQNNLAKKQSHCCSIGLTVLLQFATECFGWDWTQNLPLPRDSHLTQCVIKLRKCNWQMASKSVE